MSGPRPNPARLKLLAGNPGHRPIPAGVSGVAGTPRCPTWLTKAQKVVWKWLVSTLEKHGTVSQSDVHVMAAYCVAQARVEKANAVIEEEGEYYETDTGQKKRHPACAELSKGIQEVKQLGELLGLNPLARQKMDGPVKKDAGGGVMSRDRLAGGKERKAE